MTATDDARRAMQRLQKQRRERELNPILEVNCRWKEEGKAYLTHDQVVEVQAAAYSGIQSANSLLGRDLEKVVQDLVEKLVKPLFPGAKLIPQWLPEGARRGRGGTNAIDSVLIAQPVILGFSPKHSAQAGGAWQIWGGELEMLRANYPGRKVKLVAILGSKKKQFAREMLERSDMICLHMSDMASLTNFLREVRLLAGIAA